MKKLIMVGITILAFSVDAMARNEVLEYSFKDALSTEKAKEVLDPTIKIHYGKGAKGKIILKGITSNKKTNKFAKADQDACYWALYSAFKSFQQRAIREGGSRAVNLESYLDRKTIKDKSKFQCRVGTFTAAVVLKGDIAK